MRSIAPGRRSSSAAAPSPTSARHASASPGRSSTPPPAANAIRRRSNKPASPAPASDRLNSRAAAAGDPFVAQLALQHFSDGATWQRIDDFHRIETLRLAEAAVRPFAQCLGRSVASLAQHDERDRRFAPGFRRHADDARFLDIRMRANDRFKITWIDIEAAGNDHVLAAVHQLQEPVGIETADIAGAYEALARGIAPFGFRGLFRLVVVAVHHRRRVADDLADFSRADLAPVLVDQADVVAF